MNNLNFKRLSLIILIYLGISGCQISVKSLFDTANKLYENGEYLESILLFKEIIEKYPSDELADDALYLIWKCEREIGQKADILSQNKENENHKYYIYISKNRGFFSYYEPNGSYRCNEERYKQMLQLFPDSEFVDNMKYYFIKMCADDAWEDGDGRSSNPWVIKEYKDFLTQYPNSEFRNEVKEQIKRLKEMAEKVELPISERVK